MDLQTAIGLRPGELVAFVGAGGKSTAAWRLLCTLASSGERAVFATTTHIFQPRSAPLILASNPNPTDIARALTESPTLFLAAARGERGDPEHAARSSYPARSVKLVGLEPEVLSGLAQRLPGVTWLVEADGAKGRLLKAPAEHEPVIPGEATRVVIVACLDVIGKPLDDRAVHRPEIAARLLRVSPGATLTPDLLASLINHPSGGLKGIPQHAEAVALLTQWDKRPSSRAGMVARQLLSGHRVHRVALANLRASDPVLEVWG